MTFTATADYAKVAYLARDEAERRFERIIGNSPGMECVLDQVEQVALTDSTVLIEGETGTGKELIAPAVHNASQGCGRAFIKLNCSAIPLDLLESGLFGHENGVFTGAIAQKIGRFEWLTKAPCFSIPGMGENCSPSHRNRVHLRPDSPTRRILNMKRGDRQNVSCSGRRADFFSN